MRKRWIQCVMLSLVMFALPIYGAVGQSSKDSCVQAIAINGVGAVHEATVLNTRTGKVITDRQAPIPPYFPDQQNRMISYEFSWSSPNGNFVVYWQFTSKEDIALVLVSTVTRQTRIIYHNTWSNLAVTDQYPWLKWSPDSKQVAFVQDQYPKYAIAIVDAETGKQRIIPLSAPPGRKNIDRVFLYGWSADNQYLAAARLSRQKKDPYDWSDISFDLNVWSNDTLALVSTGIQLEYRLSYGNDGNVAWSLQAHKLAIVLGPYAETKLAVWSPENGIERSAFVEIEHDQYVLVWSPGGQQIRLKDYWGHGAKYKFFAAHDLNKRELGSRWLDFVGWMDDDTAITIDLYLDAKFNQLLYLNPATGLHQVVDTGAFSPSLSPDGNYVAYLIERSMESGYQYTGMIADKRGKQKVPFFSATTHESKSGLIQYTAFNGIFRWTLDSRYTSTIWDYDDDEAPEMYSNGRIIISNTDLDFTHE
jgi:hypothetical protein